MKMSHLEIPAQFNRNSANVLAVGVEKTGATLIACGNELLGCADLAGKDVLDMGCGGRFTQTIINRDLPIGSYTGIDIDEPLIAYLRGEVRDSRFTFHYWDVHNELYHKAGRHLTEDSRLPVGEDRKFDVIWMYSVITHNRPADAGCLFRILRRHVRKGGCLLVSAIIDNEIEEFEDREKNQPLSYACYNEKFLRKILSRAGWRMEALYPRKPDTVMQHLYLCRPKRAVFGWFL